MRALRLDGPSGVRLESSHPTPARREGEARVRVTLAGICDTDLQLARGYMSHRGVLGHEFVGTVLEADAPGLRGRRVVADINAGCGRCKDCLARDGHHCAERTVLGIVARDGALAEELTIPARCLVEVPDHVDDERAVFAEPIAAALHVLDALPTRTSPRALVLGDGKLGLLIALALRGAGVVTTVVGRHARKLEVARAAGCEVHLDAEAPAGLGKFALVVEATGSPLGLHAALARTAPRGTLVLKSTVADPVTIDAARLVVDEIALVGSRCGDIRRAIDAVASGAIDPRPLIEARYPLAHGEEAFAHASRRGALKILVQP
jgi:threonine dehydrogenase-like Zn-dependent dehydrogenase